MARAIRAPFPSVALPAAEFHPEPGPTWERLLSDVAAARRRVWLETYILEDGVAADALLEAVTEARQRGAEVRILVDDFGSMFLSARTAARFREAGVAFKRYNPVRWLAMLWQGAGRYARRTHRRIVVVDERVAWTGGIAVADRWWSGAGTLSIRDAMLRVEGELVGQMALAFDELWSGERLPRRRHWPKPRPGEARCIVQHPGRRLLLRSELGRSLADVRQRAWLATPYFVPPRKLRRTLRHVARAGVDVRLLLPGPRQHDHPAIRFASRRYYLRLLLAGIRIWEYQPTFQHAKVTLLDDGQVQVGSANLDRWSWLRNHEVMIAAHDPALCTEVADWFERELLQSKEITLEDWGRRSWLHRAAERFFGLFEHWY